MHIFTVSNHWKNGQKSFQWLEKPFKKFPMIGNKKRDINPCYAYTPMLAFRAFIGLKISGLFSEESNEYRARN